MTKIVSVHATPKVATNELHPTDRDVPEQTTIEINAAVPSHHLANAALDVFHDQIAIKNLEDFTLETHHKGQPITPCEDDTNYHSAGQLI